MTRLASLYRDHDQRFLPVPVFVEGLTVLGLEFFESATLFQRDLQLGQVQVLGVAEALQEEPVHDFGDALVACTNASVGRNVEDDCFRRDMLSNASQQDLRLRVSDALRQQLCCTLAGNSSVLQRKAQVLRIA